MFIVADNIHGLNPIVADAMEKLDPEPIRVLARKCAESNADFIDINPGYLSKRRLDRMEFLVETVENSVALPLILDSPNPAILRQGLSVCRKKPILNALSLEAAKIEEILPLAVEHKTNLVLLLMDEKSYTPPSLEEKIAIAIELRTICLNGGLVNDNLIMDPVLPNVSWDDAMERISAGIELIRLMSTGALFEDPMKTMVGLSNLRSGKSNVPNELETVCLTLLAGAGLSFVLANVMRPSLHYALNWILKMLKVTVKR